MEKFSKPKENFLLLIGFVFLFLFSGFTSQKVLALDKDYQLVLFLAGSSPDPLEDLSSINHDVKKIGEVGVIQDEDLGRKVYSFEDIGILKIGKLIKGTIEDSEYLDYYSDEAMTIEINAKVPNLSVNQVILNKGNLPEGLNYKRNYGFSYSNKETSGFPLFSFLYGTWTFGLTGLDDDISEWNVYTVKIFPQDGSLTLEWFVNGSPGKCEGCMDKQDFNVNDYPLYIGSGYSTQKFEVQPFLGYIDYVRIYKGLLPEEKLNFDPTGIIPYADINIDPDILNTKSRGKWITTYIDLPEQLDVNNIDTDTIKLKLVDEENKSVEVEWGEIQDATLMVKFAKEEVINNLLQAKSGEVELKITGNLKDETPFKGTDTINVK